LKQQRLGYCVVEDLQRMMEAREIQHGYKPEDKNNNINQGEYQSGYETLN